MGESEEIRGDLRDALFLDLQDYGTLMRMSVAGKDYPLLTVVTGLRITPPDACFGIDCPEPWREQFLGSESRTVTFEFTGRDRLFYSFSVRGGWLDGESLWHRLPEAIDRLQRRSAFRIEVPPESLVIFRYLERAFCMRVVNLSVEGALGVLLMPLTQPNDMIFKGGECLEDLRLRIPSSADVLEVSVMKAEIRRVEIANGGTRGLCAIQFLQMEKADEKALTRIVYESQRKYLQRRILLEKGTT